MSGPRTTIADGSRLPNIHPDEVLPLGLLIGSKIAVADNCHGSRVKARIVVRLSNEEAAIDATIDLRLARYFGMSEGFFLDLLQDYDLEEARAHRDVPERIVRRAAR